MVTLINLERTDKLTYDFSLGRRDTVVEKRGDQTITVGSEGCRGASCMLPPTIRQPQTRRPGCGRRCRDRNRLAQFHGAVQFVGRPRRQQPMSPASLEPRCRLFGGNLELAFVGQQSFAGQAPHRICH
jgi:hypothetical protein